MFEPTQALHIHWCAERGIINLRCDTRAPGVGAAVAQTLGMPLVEEPNTSVHHEGLRIVWVGPDEWQVISTEQDAFSLETRLRHALVGQHMAVTDVSSHYHILRLSGASARAVLAQGCPLDLHPRVFAPGDCAGSHYFKAQVWLWQIDAQPCYELLVRRSFAGYVGLMVERASVEQSCS